MFNDRSSTGGWNLDYTGDDRSLLRPESCRTSAQRRSLGRQSARRRYLRCRRRRSFRRREHVLFAAECVKIGPAVPVRISKFERLDLDGHSGYVSAYADAGRDRDHTTSVFEQTRRRTAAGTEAILLNHPTGDWYTEKNQPRINTD